MLAPNTTRPDADALAQHRVEGLLRSADVALTEACGLVSEALHRAQGGVPIDADQLARLRAWCRAIDQRLRASGDG